ncbi:MULTISPECIES: DUF1127 domain-containing protein [unclassified Bradyrhizobium]|uniref:DUF1127 domain-containing protein n=1 Tax=unclassified Bradyrhizobium TaxID=2631580 RepID=UPI001CD5620F|nr:MULTISPECIES: DUF1127 domain-containing protein [unclassified Bradyrhizobium]
MDEVASTGRSCSSRPAMFVRACRALLELLQARRARSRVRCQLAAMTERELQDFGMSRSEIEHELRKPVRRK